MTEIIINLESPLVVLELLTGEVVIAHVKKENKTFWTVTHPFQISEELISASETELSFTPWFPYVDLTSIVTILKSPVKAFGEPGYS